MAKFDLNDDGVVVIVGSGAGGGTLGNELAQKGIKVVILEAGARNEIQDFINNETELVVIVTPYLVKPTSPADLQTPVDGLRIASDVDTILLGHLNKTFKHDPQATEGKTYQGPYGYVVE